MIICYSTFAPDRISAITKKKLLTAAIIRVMHLIVEEDLIIYCWINSNYCISWLVQQLDQH
ncbi:MULTISPECIES: hypothetical protein [Bacillus]|uniref:hypothetical protein n=1 Tax=Bacillus TaxID=1386 RepID=UPI00037EA45E|nr:MULTISPECIES: hypothetical protein [Bacillus]